MKKYISFFCVIAIPLIIFMCNVCYAGEDCLDFDKKFEPVVTKKEAELLNQVVDLAKDDVQKAIELIMNNYDANSSSSLDFALGNLHFQSENLKSAKKWYLSALKKFPEFLRAKENLSKVYISEENMKDALTLLQDIVDHGVIKKDNLILMGYLLLNENKSIAAEMYYKEVIKRYPDEVKGYLGLAKSKLLQEQYNEALKILKEILDIDPSKKEVWQLLSNCYMQKDDTFNSIVTLEASRILGLLDSKGLMTLGDLYLHENMPSKAVSVYELLLGKEMDYKRILRAIEGFIMIEEYDEAEKLLNKIDLGSSNQKIKDEHKVSLGFMKAKILFHKNQFQKSIQLLEELFKVDQMNGEIVFFLAMLYERTDQIERARHFYQASIDLNHNKLGAYIKLAMIEIRSQNIQKALDLFAEAQSIQFQTHIAKYMNYLESFLN